MFTQKLSLVKDVYRELPEFLTKVARDEAEHLSKFGSVLFDR